MKPQYIRLHRLWQCVQLALAACLSVQGLTLKSGRRMELTAEALEKATMKNGPLFPVGVNYDWENTNPKYGVTVKMDHESGTLKMVSGVASSPADVAWGYMADELDEDGWIKLFITTTDADPTRISNDVRMYAAGFMEGLVSAVRMSQFYSNVYQTIIKDETAVQSLNVIKTVFEEELEFVKKNANFHPGVISIEPADPYWKHMRFQFIQLWGIKDGYNVVAMKKGVRQLDMIDMMVINSHAELPELLQAYSREAMKKRKAFQDKLAQQAATGTTFLQGSGITTGNRSGSLLKSKAVSPKPSKNVTAAELAAVDKDWEMRLAKRGRCSALVRAAPENKDLLVGHTTWGDYSSMTRIFKYYHFHLPGAYTRASKIGMSSYPGCISSTDDYYIMDSGLVVMDTSLEILNMDLYDRVKEFPANSHVPNFMHIMTSNRMAETAPHWAVLFTERNSGTDNAQWMVVDYNRFVPENPIPDNALWVIEQVPGMSFKKDVTYILRDKGYWASYNRPYFPQIREMSGHTAAEGKYGALYSWDNGPRAEIFRSVAPLSEHIMDMRSIMNRNMWPHEGVSQPAFNEPGHAISSRLDLSFSKIPNGGIDAKVINRCLFRSMQTQCISGPTHDKQTVFKWMDGQLEYMKGWPHLGLPNVWNFDWIQMSPTQKLNAIVDVEKCA